MLWAVVCWWAVGEWAGTVVVAQCIAVTCRRFVSRVAIGRGFV